MTDKCEFEHPHPDHPCGQRVFEAETEKTFEGTEEHPIYRKVEHNDGWATQLYLVICDEGWRESIVCERMYEWTADWLVEELQGKPYAPGRAPKEIGRVKP